MPGRLIFATTSDGADSSTERMRIDSAGRVGINAVPTDYNDYGDGLVVRKSSITGSSGMTIQAPNNTGYSSLYFGDPDDTKVGGLEYFHTTDSLTIQSGNATTMVLDGSQRVLIGHTSSIPNGGDNQQLQVTGTGSSDGISLARFNTTYGAYFTIGRAGDANIGTYVAVPNNSDLGRIQFAVADGTDMSSIGAMILSTTEQAAASNDTPANLRFMTTADGNQSPTERARINSGGTFMVGKTSESSTTDGCELRNGQSGYTATFTADENNTSEVISIQHKDTTQPTKHIILRDYTGNTKGTLGVSTETNSTGMFLGFGDTGLSFQAETDNAITPVSANDGVTRTELIDLGSDAARFKDLYLSGGIQFDSRSNKLDDYEEGTWNPNVRGGTTAGTYGLLFRSGRYRKIGNLVHCDATFYANSFTGAGDFEVSGLPFTVNASSPGGLCLVQWNSGPFATFSVDNQTVVGLLPANNTYIHFRACDRVQGSTHVQLQCGNSTIEYLRLSLTYETA